MSKGEDAAGARYVVRDPTGILDDVSCSSEAAAIRYREGVEKTYEWGFQIVKVFPSSSSSGNCTILNGCIPPGQRPTELYRITVLEQKIVLYDREMKILTDRKMAVQGLIDELRKNLEKPCSSQ